MEKIYIKTFGCPTNFSESEIMAGLLAKAGFKISEGKQANVVILNICTVKNSNKALKEIKKTKQKFSDKKLIVAGCIPHELTPKLKEFSLTNTHNIKSIVKVVNETLKGKTIKFLKKKNDIKICLPRIRKNPSIGIIPIASGCKSNCSYCSVRLIKGRLFSYPLNKIIQEAKQSLKQNCKELWITSQDAANYSLDKNKKSQLPILLNKISSLRGNFFIRVGMMNPQNVLPVLNNLIKAYKSEKIFKFLHIPVQSGSNRVLRLMNRTYTIEQFEKIIIKFRKEIPRITIATDIICGFPTESDLDFKRSIELIKKIKPDILNISRFWPRPGTEAAFLKQIPGWITKKRSTTLTKEFDKIALQKNKRWIKWKGTILIDEEGKDSTLIGRNYIYKPIIIKTRKNLLGKFVNVKINKVTKYDLRATVIQ